MFKDILKITFNHVIDWIILFFSVIIPICITFFGLPQIELKEKFYIVFIFTLTTMIIYLIKLFFNTIMIIEKQKIILPKLKLIKDNYYIFEPCELYSPQMYVSLYYCSNNLEKFIGYGIIETVISNTNNLQVKIIEFQGENIDNDFCLKNKVNIFLKPSVPCNIEQKFYICKETVDG